jgi:hypothetical protein
MWIMFSIVLIILIGMVLTGVSAESKEQRYEKHKRLLG